MTGWRRICCAVDFSRESRRAMEEAAELAWRFVADLTLVHVDDRPGAAVGGEALAAVEAVARGGLELERQLGEWAGVASRIAARSAAFELLAGDPATEIVRFAREHACDAVVMGTHGRGERERLEMGSVAEAVVRAAPCAVVVVRGAERAEAAEGARAAAGA